MTEKSTALASYFSSAQKPGGRLLVLEFSKPTSEVLSKIYDTYSFLCCQNLGQLALTMPRVINTLAESIRMHPDQETLEGIDEDVGFEQKPVNTNLKPV